MRKLIIFAAFILAACQPIRAPLSPIYDTVPYGTVPSRTTLYMPMIGSVGATGPCGMDVMATQLAFLFTSDPLQQRSHPQCDVHLVYAAQARARDMVDRQYFSHTDPGGKTPNYWARYYGCNLPDYYKSDANNIESIGLNYPTAQAEWDAWLASPAHRAHVLGAHPFYAAQVLYGFAVAQNGERRVFVVMTAKEC